MSLLLSLSLLASCEKQVASEGTAKLTVSILGSNDTKEVEFVNETLLNILKNTCQLKTKDSIYTEYVECINGVCANDDFSWVYYINDDPMNEGADVYRVQDDENILVIYTKI